MRELCLLHALGKEFSNEKETLWDRLKRSIKQTTVRRPWGQKYRERGYQEVAEKQTIGRDGE